jgi:YHS domain-containing protein
MKKFGVALLTMALALGPAGTVLAQKAPGKAQTEAQTKTPTQTVCPVLAGKVNKDIYVDYKGHRIYFCCEGCDKEFKKDPEKYMKKLEAQGVELEKSPAAAGKKGK